MLYVLLLYSFFCLSWYNRNWKKSNKNENKLKYTKNALRCPTNVKRIWNQKPIYLNVRKMYLYDLGCFFLLIFLSHIVAEHVFFSRLEVFFSSLLPVLVLSEFSVSSGCISFFKLWNSWNVLNISIRRQLPKHKTWSIWIVSVCTLDIDVECDSIWFYFRNHNSAFGAQIHGNFKHNLSFLFLPIVLWFAVSNLNIMHLLMFNFIRIE